ncbi:MAG: hypothetical protein MRZ28_09470 [Oscillospiraceae bacterium]|nr:hypothetical protein [Oscillospiraceae bacterium]MCM0708382.1 hypothetical protein [Faecalicatena sp. BF-R-105]MDY3218713.1 hypothetical protein [Candidatus Fimivivens sp.]SFI53467.1 hypothetical protein SAMN02910435_00299 [Ruminococcaceae bacterium D5]GKH50107.1 hypothetical protein CE91St46_12180 [Eubacteriales bacterium]
MKKFLAMLLSVSMVASMSAVSFAVSGSSRTLSGTPDKTTPADAYASMIKDGKYDDDDGYPIDTTLIGPFGYNSDDKNLTIDSVEYGKTAYFLLTEYYLDSGDDEQTRLVTQSESTDKLKVKGDWEEGKSLVDGMAITKKKVNGFGTYDDLDDKDNFTEDKDFTSDMVNDYGFVSGKYYYMVAITVEDSSSTSDADIIGTLTLSKSKKPKADDIDFDVAINVDWEQSYRKTEDLTITGDYDPIYSETYYALKFDCDEEVELGFNDDSTFTVDVSGQPKTLLYFDTDFNSSIAAKYPLAELNFWNGNGAKFNRTGEMFLSIGDEDYDDYYLYQINSDGSLSEVPNAEYDDADEGFYFKTRTLGSYVVSDMELDTSATESSDESDDIVVTPVDPVTPVNPGTGARA